MINNIAKVISYILHPLLIPTYVILIIIYYNPYFNYLMPPNLKALILLILFILTFFIPAMLMLLMKHLKIISSLTMDKQEERTLPLLLTTISLYAAFYVFKSLKLPFNLYEFLLIAAALTLIGMIINLRIKISLHAIGMGAFTAFVFNLKNYNTSILFGLFVMAIFLSGLAMTSRLKLKLHSLFQIFLGYFIAFLFTMSLLK